MAFRLLNAPQLILANVINLLPPNELITLSLCSQKVHSLVKMHRSKSKKWEIWISCDPNRRISVDFDRSGDFMYLLAVEHISKARKPLETMESVIINWYKVPCIIDKKFGNLVTFWEDVNLGLQNIVIYTFGFLEQNNIAVLMFGKEGLWIMDWVISRQMIIEDIHMDMPEQLTSEEYSHVLRNCKLGLLIYSIPPEDFRYEGTIQNCSALCFRPAFWITIDNLILMDSMSIDIYDSRLTSDNINQYLKNWLNGGSPRLKYLSVEMKNYVFEDVIKGIEDKVRLVERKRTFVWIDGASESFDEAHDIKRSDGVTASLVRRQWNVPGGGLTDYFKMLVWPDFGGKSYPELEEINE